MSEITCPSGMKLEIRGLKGKELRFFQDRKSAREGTVLDKVLGACVLAVNDPGPYTFADAEGAATESVDWNEVLLGDEFYTLVAVRKETFGPKYGFKVQCPECRKRFDWELDLNDLPVNALSESSADAVRDRKPLAVTVDGQPVKFRLLTGRDEREMMKTRSAENPLVSMMALSISAIGDVVDKSQIRRLLEEKPLGELMALRKKFDESDCGVETDIEVECPDCSAIKDITLPLGQGFLSAPTSG